VWLAEVAKLHAGVANRGPHGGIAQRLELGQALVRVVRLDVDRRRGMAGQLGRPGRQPGDQPGERLGRDALRQRRAAPSLAVEGAAVPRRRSVPYGDAQKAPGLREDGPDGLVAVTC
jgi:hypothetical protein